MTITKAVIRKEIERTEKKFRYVYEDYFDDPETRSYVDGYLEALYFLINGYYLKPTKKKRKKK